ncbi:MAG: beta-ketoacyl-[acyl-carrier-protein] synthase family protein [Planctomycetes bacterium]|nr:beta-ketoacyl-[acyl-carrier-protein] synthase family protein [Planctomycetota bacterium]MCP4770779.1 beta-ketoacyl-[acyl-carrier-protein] synthase family protein [Planctomycetota bacterium]MCP4862150.1 beta-ketoacyl-[acyl-carrier-protein] synthase family protein [Planctomycetota bacterium]
MSESSDPIFCREAVITGIGIVSPVGISREENWEGFLAGRSGIDIARGWDSTDEDVRLAGEVPEDFEERFLDKVKIPFARRFGRFTQFALMAGQEAIEQAGIDIEQTDPERIAVVLGVGGGATHYLGPMGDAIRDGDSQKFDKNIDHYFVIKTMFNAPAGMLAIQHGFQGPSTMVSAACASGSVSVSTGLDWIRSGRADVVIVGGVESTINRETIQAYWRVRALTNKNDLGSKACCPFDKNRSGFVMGEGAGIMVLESKQHAEARGAKILARVMGSSMVSEAYKIATPQMDGVGMARAIHGALKDSGVAAERITHISAHAPSTPQGDLAESRAINLVFGDHTGNISVTAPKSAFGHALAASSGIQTALLALSLERGKQIPTQNLEEQDPEILLDVVHDSPRDSNDDYAMVNAFGFGGHNVSVVLGKA